MTGHALRFHNEIFEDFVEAGAQMDFAGGIGRPVMQNEQGLAFACFEDAVINIAPVPSFKLLGLILRQAGLHGKIGLREVERLFQFKWFGHNHESPDIPFGLYAVLWSRYPAGNIGKQCKIVCYNE